MLRGDSESALVRAVIELSHTLGLTVVAEGVEAPDQLRQLRRFWLRYCPGVVVFAGRARRMAQLIGTPRAFCRAVQGRSTGAA